VYAIRTLVEMAAAENEEPVEALAAHGPDPAFGVRSRLRCPHGRFDHADAFGAEDLVEFARELAVAVTDKEPGSGAISAGGTPAALITLRTSVAETSMPSLRYSPTIRT